MWVSSYTNIEMFYNLFFFSTGNKLTCDCRLSWLHKLRNETKSKRVKASLSRLNCIMDTKTNINTVKIEKSQKAIQSIQGSYKKDIDYEEEEFEEKHYDDAMQDQETENDDTTIKIEYKRKLLEIPAEMLPCPNRLIYEASYSPPTQDEVKYYKTSSSEMLVATTMNLLLVVVATL